MLDQKKNFSIVFFFRERVNINIYRAFHNVFHAIGCRKGLFLFVIFPNLFYIFYLSFIASPQYVSEAHFMVRSERNQNGTPLAMLLQAGGEGITSENTYAVQDYMMSRDAMNLLIKNDKLGEVFSSPAADFIARYPNWYSRRDRESFYHYYRRHVKAQIDAETSLSVLKVRTFSAKDSKRIATALLESAENLINDINNRQRQDMINAAQKEVSETMERLKNLQLKIATFRDSNAIIDPEKQSVPLIGTEYALQSMLISTKMKLEQAQISAPDSPSIPIYRQQIEVLTDEIKRASARLTGDTNSIVPKLSEYDSMNIERMLLQKILTSEVTSLEAAKEKADRQMVFLEEITIPSEPDYPDYPKNIQMILISVVCSYSIYIMGRLLLAGAREHKIS